MTRALTVSPGASKIIQEQFNVNKPQTINGCLTRRVPFKYQMKWLLEDTTLIFINHGLANSGLDIISMFQAP